MWVVYKYYDVTAILETVVPSHQTKPSLNAAALYWRKKIADDRFPVSYHLLGTSLP